MTTKGYEYPTEHFLAKKPPIVIEHPPKATCPGLNTD